MAYDPNDPADKAIVDKIVKEALENQQQEHETEIQGLKDKNSELLGKIRKLRTEGGSENSAEIERLERELSETQSKLRKSESDLRTVNRDLQNVTGERDQFKQTLQTEQEFSRSELINNRLTSALVEANVAPQFLDDVAASLSRQVTIREKDGKREAFVGDEPLGEFVKTWSQGDKGKHYIVAPVNGGAGTQNPGSPQGGKKIIEMNEAERVALFRQIGEQAFNERLQNNS